MHRDTYTAAHGDTVDDCYVGSAQLRDQVVQAVL